MKMGHYQNVTGKLKFPETLSKEAREKLEALLDPYIEYKIYIEEEKYTNDEYMDLEIGYGNDLVWNGGSSGKSVMSHNTINHLIKLMKEEFPEFVLTGSMKVIDLEMFKDHYFIDMIDNVAVKVPIEMIRKGSVCKHCGKEI